MEKTIKMSPFRLSSLLRIEKDPNIALNLFLNPNSNSNSNSNSISKPFKYTPLSYDLIITKLGRAKMYEQMENIIKMLKNETRFVPKEVIFCNVINVYSRAKMVDKALDIFEKIESFGCKRTIKSVNTMMNVLLKNREFGKNLFVGFGKYVDFFDVCTFNILINYCFLRNDLVSGYKLFDEMCSRKIKPNEVTFGTLVYGLCANNKINEAIKLKESMLSDFNVNPSVFVYAALIKELCKKNELSVAFELKDEMVKSVGVNCGVYGCLISALFKNGRKEDAIRLVEELKQNECKLDNVVYNTMIGGFCLEKDFDAAFRVLDEMEKNECRPDVISFNIIIGGLCREGHLKEATDLFRNMSEWKCVPDIVAYRTLFDGLCDGSRYEEAIFFLDEMVLKGYAPRSESVAKFLNELVQGGDLKLLSTVLSSLGKGNLLDSDMWEMVVPLFCQNNDHSKGSKFVDSLVML